MSLDSTDHMSSWMSSLAQVERALAIEVKKRATALNAYESDETNPLKEAEYNVADAKVAVAKCKRDFHPEGKAARIAEARAKVEEIRMKDDSDPDKADGIAADCLCGPFRQRSPAQVPLCVKWRRRCTAHRGR